MTNELKETTMQLIQRMRGIGIIPVIKLEDTSKAQALAGALMAGGIECAEVTFRAEGADKVIASMRAAYPTMLVGAGTVTTKEQVDRAIKAGASFCVAPGFNPSVVQHCLNSGVPFIPGIATCSELESAMELGLPAVKFFPAEQAGGLAYIKAVCAAYSNVVFMPTGGVSQKNMTDYLSFSRVFCCGGSFLTPQDAIQNSQFDKITQICLETRKTLKTIGR